MRHPAATTNTHLSKPELQAKTEQCLRTAPQDKMFLLWLRVRLVVSTTLRWGVDTLMVSLLMR